MSDGIAITMLELCRLTKDGALDINDDGRYLAFPCDRKGAIVLDGAFDSADLRAIADWLEAQEPK